MNQAKKAGFAFGVLILALLSVSVFKQGFASEGEGVPPVQSDGDLAGKDVSLFFRDEFSPHLSFKCVFALEGKVKSASGNGLLITAKKIHEKQMATFSDGSARPKENSEDYNADVFVPWCAVKYAKLAK